MKQYKDPAFLFYPESFLVGVMDMTDEEVGQYIKLMCRQHQKGHIPTAIIQRASEAVQEKFVQDDEGKWYNERLEKEIVKRAKFTESRRRNLESKKEKKEEKPQPKKTEKKSSVAGWIKEVVPEELVVPFLEWASMRAQIKKPITTKATVTRNYNALLKLSKNTEKQKRIIEQSVDRCWQSFYELKEEVKPNYMKEFEKEEEVIDAVPMPDEVREKLSGLGIKIGG